MTSSIKPPGFTAPPRSAVVKGGAEASGQGSTTGVGSAPGFADVAAEALAAAGARNPHRSGELPVAAASPFDALAAALSGGNIDATDAVSELVDRALASPMASALTDRGRERLAEHLRDSLVNDPTLAGMVRDLERGS